MSDQALITELGLRSSNTGIEPKDAFQTNASFIANTILRSIREGNNTIILHLGGPNAPQTREAMELFIPELIKKDISLNTSRVNTREKV